MGYFLLHIHHTTAGLYRRNSAWSFRLVSPDALFSIFNAFRLPESMFMERCNAVLTFKSVNIKSCSVTIQRQ